MAELTLVSAGEQPLKPLIEAALANQLKLLKAGSHRSEERIREFEERYRMSTRKFIHKFENDELEETLEFAEWIGEYRMLEKLRLKIDILQEVRFGD